MKVEKRYNWLNKKMLTAIGQMGTVRAVTQEGRDLNLLVQMDDGLVGQFSCWGENLNRLIDLWGTETDMWKNRRLLISTVQNLKGQLCIEVKPQ